MQEHERETKRGRRAKLLTMLEKVVRSGLVRSGLGKITSSGLTDEEEEIKRKRRKERNRSQDERERDMAK